MGLAERRAIKSFRENHFEGLKKQIDEACGFETNVEVDWDQLAKEDYAHLYDEALPKVYFNPVVEAFKDICQDDMGKEALQEMLKGIVFCNTADKWSPTSSIEFKEGKLTVDHSPVSNVDDVTARKDHIVSILEKAL